MTSAQTKRQKLTNAANTTSSSTSTDSNNAAASNEFKETTLLDESQIIESSSASNKKATINNESSNNTFGVDVDDLTDDTDTDDDEDDGLDDETVNGDKTSDMLSNHMDIQEQLAAAGPAGVAAAAAIATARKRKRPHSFETNPSVRKRQQTRLIRKLRACIDEYTMRVGQQAVVLITMPGKAVHNFKVFGAQPLESVIRACKHEIMTELEQALLEQAPQQFKEDTNKHELPPLVIDGIPTPVEKMTQAQLRAFIPLMLKYSTGRGKPGWGKDSTRPPWWPETLPWANVRSDARDEAEKQRISWTTTLRQIVTNCYRYHGRDDLLPTFDENEEAAAKQESQAEQASAAAATRRQQVIICGRPGKQTKQQQEMSQQEQQQLQQQHQQQMQQPVYQANSAYASNFVHTITNSDGTVSLIQVDPANAQILTLPDGTQVRAVRLQTLGTDSFNGQQLGELHEAGVELGASLTSEQHGQQEGQQQGQMDGNGEHQGSSVSVSEASLNSDGQIILTGEDGTQSCYPMSSLVSIPASVYQQFAQAGQQLSIVTADGSTIPANALSIHAIQDDGQQQQQANSQQLELKDSLADVKIEASSSEPVETVDQAAGPS